MYTSNKNPAPYSTGSMPAIGNPKALLATYDSFSDSLNSFVEKHGDAIKGITDPVKFSQTVQNVCKFGINTETGKNEPGFVDSFVRVLDGVRKRLPKSV